MRAIVSLLQRNVSGQKTYSNELLRRQRDTLMGDRHQGRVTSDCSVLINSPNDTFRMALDRFRRTVYFLLFCGIREINVDNEPAISESLPDSAKKVY
jgi:hypothetical protein